MMETEIYAKDRAEWREWLRKNHNKKTKVSLICYKKHTGNPSLSHRESMEEAICFGWIDTTVKRIDEEKYIRRFSKRSENGKWSNNTLRYARELIKQRKMTKAGLKAYENGLKNPVLDHGLPKNPSVPADLRRSLEKNKVALKNFNSFAPSYKRFYIVWLTRAKKQETREKRIKEIVERSFQNRKPGN